VSEGEGSKGPEATRALDEAAKQRLIIELFQNAHVPMWATDEHHRIVLWNRGAEDVYGWDADDVLGKSYLELFVSADEREDSERDAVDILQNNKRFKNYLASDTGHDGNRKDVLTNCFRIRDPESREAFQAEISVHIPEFDLRDAEREHGRLVEAVRARRREEQALLTGQRASQQHVIDLARDRLSRAVDAKRSQLQKLEKAWHRKDQARTDMKKIAAANLQQLDADSAEISSTLNELARRVAAAETARSLEQLVQLIREVENRIESLMQ
jgi:PAS domain S-box-containing protein